MEQKMDIDKKFEEAEIDHHSETDKARTSEIFHSHSHAKSSSDGADTENRSLDKSQMEESVKEILDEWGVGFTEEQERIIYDGRFRDLWLKYSEGGDIEYSLAD
mmetsp:Transcript_32227/g.49303  ORF Transcript_32227/g.49303 Transcript_32227/m.49303 type:complete len:104 (+) Transcript_32227:954-1265(+)